MMYRLPPVDGEWIDRSRPLRMRFEGREVEAFAGDTLTSALAAAGVMTTARSFKYHRRRGPYSAAGHDANNLFQIGSEPNQRGDQILARDGLAFEAVNTFGGVAQDRASAMRWLSRFLPVGFYYKVFMGRHTFPRFEALIRRMSGLGRVDLDAASTLRERRHAHCDVAVIGAGLSGLSAALAAVQAGARRVWVIDEAQQPGGSALWLAGVKPAQREQALALIEQLRSEPAIRLLCGHSVVGYYTDHELLVSRIDREHGGAVLLRAGAVVLATGCIEQPAVFRNNDLPGVMLASAAQRLAYRHAVAAGRRVVLLGGTAGAVDVALDLRAQGLDVIELALLECADAERETAAATLPGSGIALRAGVKSLAAEADSHGNLAAVLFEDGRGSERVACDSLLMATGWMPALHLALQAGAVQRFDASLGQHVPERLPPGLFVAGRANGVFDASQRRLDGVNAGRRAAARARGQALPALIEARRATTPQSPIAPLFPHERGGEFVDLDEDLTLADLANAAQEGFDSVELLKRYSTVGMGPSQGKLSNLNAARQLARVTGKDWPALGLTTARPPWQPVSLGALAGLRVAPERRTCFDAWHAAHGAAWMPAGNWRRPAYYARDGHTAAQCTAVEVAAVRNGAGIIDVSTLGKIDVLGPDAALLLERLYTGKFADMGVGRTRYALMVDEAGTITDDGVVARLGTQHFYVTATTGGSAAVYREMQRRVAEWQLDCTLHNLTGHFAALNIAGPRARALLATCTSLALDAGSFPFLAAREAEVAGVASRLARVGFVGELGYEIHVRADQALAVWEALVAAGATPFGVEAQRVLRLEKGHVIVSQDTDGVTNPFEAGMHWAVKMDKPFFVGQRSLAILKARGDRQRLIGFRLPNPDAPLRESHLAIEGDEIIGRVTSIARSAAVGHTIGLALLRPDRAVAGAHIRFRDDHGVMHAAELLAPPFYDPAGQRQNVEDAQ